jgi:iron complex transport system substrate-binding protein
MKKKLMFLLLITVPLIFSHGYATAEKKSGDTVTVTDSAGRVVTVPRNIKRIACLYAFTGHVTAMLGRGDDIVAVVKGLKRDVMLMKICPSIEKAAVPNQSDTINIEEIARVRPDIVFIRSASANKKNAVDNLDRLKIPYVIIEFSTIQGQMDAVSIIGKVLGREKKAAEYNSYYTECISRAKKIAAAVPRDKKLRLYHAVLEPEKTYGRANIAAEWSAAAGVLNVSAAESSGDEKFVNIEQIILWNPDVIIANEEGVPETIMNSSRWSSIKAVKTGRVYKMPTGISRWGHPGSLETPLALLWTVKTVYPEQSGSVNLKKETVMFYRKFFGYELPPDTLEKVLSGKGLRKSKRGGKK